jgi:hypothetical protein
MESNEFLRAAAVIDSWRKLRAIEGKVWEALMA